MRAPIVWNASPECLLKSCCFSPPRPTPPVTTPSKSSIVRMELSIECSGKQRMACFLQYSSIPLSIAKSKGLRPTADCVAAQLRAKSACASVAKPIDTNVSLARGSISSSRSSAGMWPCALVRSPLYSATGGGGDGVFFVAGGKYHLVASVLSPTFC